MTEAEFCNKSIQEGERLKRSGRYEDAFRTYLQAINAYPNNPQKNLIFYAMGKVLYLIGNADQSVSAYQYYVYLSFTPMIKINYRNAFSWNIIDLCKKGNILFHEIIRLTDTMCGADFNHRPDNNTAEARSLAHLASFFSEPAFHLGHAFFDLKEAPAAEHISANQSIIDEYRNSLLGHAIPDSQSYQHNVYNHRCIYAGSVLICSILEMRANLTPDQYQDLIDELFYTAVREP